MTAKQEDGSFPATTDLRDGNTSSKQETDPNGFEKIWSSVKSFIDENVVTDAGVIQFHQGPEDRGLVLILIKPRGGLRSAGA